MKRLAANIANIFTIALLVGCTIFVIYRSNDCFKKFMFPPEVADISFQSNADVSFPSITFCPDPDNMYKKDRYPKPYSTEVLEKCNLSFYDYTRGLKWSSENCPNPRDLYNEAIESSLLENFHFDDIGIITRAPDPDRRIKLPASDPLWTWSSVPFVHNGLCQTLKVPKNITSLGISQLNVWGKIKGLFYHLYIHNDETLFTEMDYAGAFTYLSERNTVLDIDYEALQVLHYGKAPCEDKEPYDFKTCKMDYYNKKNMETFGCTFPFQFEHEICKGENLSLMAANTMNEVRLKQCPSPCSFLKITLAGESASGGQTGMQVVQLLFKSFVKVINTKTSYSGLELLAEVGGYVGLFLGVSVFHLSDLVKKLLNFKT